MTLSDTQNVGLKYRVICDRISDLEEAIDIYTAWIEDDSNTNQFRQYLKNRRETKRRELLKLVDKRANMTTYF